MAYNTSLNAARSVKNDEFYTRYEDIEREMEAYLAYNPRLFHGKTVLLPCDDYKRSNFVRYFSQNFSRFGLAGLAATSYQADGRGQCSIIGKGFPIYGDAGQGILSSDGDFRSDEISSLRDYADLVITNPPFSLFREFLAWIVEAGKKFAVIGNMNAITYKEVFPLIKDNKVWLGATNFNVGMYFFVPKGFVYKDSYKFIREMDGKAVNRVPGVCWYSNIEHGRRHEPLALMSMADNLRFSKHKELKGKTAYDRYDNYDAIEVPFTDAIPSDYDGVMGVPISFLDKYCPEQFEILGMCENEDLYSMKTRVYTTYECKTAYLKKFGKTGTYDLNASGVITRNGIQEKVYQRILIINRKFAPNS